MSFFSAIPVAIIFPSEYLSFFRKSVIFSIGHLFLQGQISCISCHFHGDTIFTFGQEK